MSTDNSRTLEMDDWQAVQYHQQQSWLAIGLVFLGVLVAFIGAPLADDIASQFATTAWALVFMVLGDTLLFAFGGDGWSRKVIDWVFRKCGREDYPWEAHDVEVTYRDEH